MNINLSDIKISVVPNSINRIEMSDAEYFSSTYSKYISNSSLKWINPEQGGCPTLFKNGGIKYTTQSLALGSAVHELFLQPEEFELGKDLKKPTAKLGNVIDYIKINRKNNLSIWESIKLASEQANYYVNALTKDKVKNIIKKGLYYYIHSKNINDNIILLDSKTRETCIKCLTNLKTPKIHNLLNSEFIESYNEDALFITVKAKHNDKEVELQLKAKLDNWTIDQFEKVITLNDLKTTGKWLGKFMKDSFKTYHYDRQMGMYLWLLLQHCKNKYNINLKDYSYNANIIAVETTGNCNAEVFKLHKATIEKGKREFCKLLKMVAYCELYGYSDDYVFN